MCLQNSTNGNTVKHRKVACLASGSRYVYWHRRRVIHESSHNPFVKSQHCAILANRDQHAQPCLEQMLPPLEERS